MLNDRVVDHEVLAAEIETAAKTDEIMKHFRYAHLVNENARAVSCDFALLAVLVVNRAPRVPERTVALRKLLEGKDAAVRACLP